MLIEAAAKEYLVEIEVRKFTKKTITSYRNILPAAGGNGLPQVCGLVRNDMENTCSSILNVGAIHESPEKAEPDDDCTSITQAIVPLHHPRAIRESPLQTILLGGRRKQIILSF